MKKTLIVLLAITMIFTASIPVNAQSVSDLQDKQDDVQKEKEDAEKQLEQTQEKKKTAIEELNAIDEELAKVTSDLEIINTELEQTKVLLAETEVELQEAEVARERQYEIFAQRARYLYINGRSGYLQVLLESQNLGDFMNRVEYVERIVEYDKNMLTELQEAEELVQTKYNEVEQRKKEIEVLAKQQVEKKEALEKTMADKKVLVEKLKADEAMYNELILELDKSDKELEALIIQSTSNNANYSTQSAPYTGGKVGWPVPGYGNISSGYVNRVNPISGKAEKHSGLDIPAPSGTNIVAAEAGTVIKAGWSNGYGNAVIIDHGNGLSTLYGHNSSVTVNVGQTVSRGEVIAKCGSTGYSTGPHCHFEVRVNGKHTDPRPYLQ